MKCVTESLKREHQVVLQRLDRFEQALDRTDLAAIRDMLNFFDEGLSLHRRKEEEVLFPALAVHWGDSVGPIACMLKEHEDERAKFELIRAALEGETDARELEQALAAGRYILTLLRQHIAKEDTVLFPLAESALSEAEKTRVKEQMDAIGYCCPECAHAD